MQDQLFILDAPVSQDSAGHPVSYCRRADPAPRRRAWVGSGIITILAWLAFPLAFPSPGSGRSSETHTIHHYGRLLLFVPTASPSSASLRCSLVWLAHGDVRATHGTRFASRTLVVCQHWHASLNSTGTNQTPHVP